MINLSKGKTKDTILWISIGSIMIALSSVLSILKLGMPFGGSITILSMLPIILVAYRCGLIKGIVTGFVYSIIQLILGSNNLSYATNWRAAIAIILFDYIIAFSVLGLSSVFKKIWNDSIALPMGALLGCMLRYICHVISGCTVWAGVSVPTSDGLLYSLIYNSTYMIPETFLTVSVAVYLSSAFAFSGDKIIKIKNKSSIVDAIIIILANLILLAVIAFDFFNIYLNIVKSEDKIDFNTLSGLNYNAIITVTAIGIIVYVALIHTKKFIINKK